MIDMISSKFGTSVCLLFLSCSVSVVSGICPAKFEEKCQCGDVPYGPEKKMTYVTNCSDSDFDNAMMLKELPPETEVLIFVGNTQARDLPFNIFSLDANHDKLHTIDLSNNKIQSIKGKTFHKVANVKKLILNNNDLYVSSKDFHPRMFSSFTSLRELYLRNAFNGKENPDEYSNKLSDIFGNSSLNFLKILDMGNNRMFRLPYDVFCSLPSLEELYLTDNHLADINVNFSCLLNLKKLDLGNNNITSLSQQTMNSLQRISNLSLNLSNNPFKCDCDLLETYKWMLDTKIDLVNRGSYRCSDRSAVNKGKHLFPIPKEEFVCTDSKNDESGTTIIHHIILAFGIIILIIVVVLLLHKNKKQVSVFVGRFIQPIRNKFQYVSLERREDTLDV